MPEFSDSMESFSSYYEKLLHFELFIDTFLIADESDYLKNNAFSKINDNKLEITTIN